MAEDIRHPSRRKKGWSFPKLVLVGFVTILVLGAITSLIDRLTPGWEERELQRESLRLAEAELREAARARRLVERRIEEAARQARDEARREETERARAEEAQRQAEHDEACRQSASCWGDRHLSDASRSCRARVEEAARYQVRWTNRFSKPRFANAGWLSDAASGVLVYAGNRVEFQNGFGVWMPHRYECVFNPQTGISLLILIEPGR